MSHFAQLIGQSAVLQQVVNTAGIIANTDVTVLIEGDTGTGKELLAQALHKSSPRHQRDFVAVNCAALPDALAESQLLAIKKVRLPVRIKINSVLCSKPKMVLCF